MTDYIFRTTATMKPYNNRNWWIDGDIVKEKRIEADSVPAALAIWRERVQDEHYIEISDTAIERPSPMYVDGKDGEPVQVGFVITGKTEFEDRDNFRSSNQYINLWVDVLTVTPTKF